MAIPERSRKVGPAAFLGLCVLIAAVFLVMGHGSSNKSAGGSPTVSTATSSDTPGQAPIPANPTSPAPANQSKGGGTTQPVVNQKLLTELDLFIGTYSNVKPEDTAATRAARMPSFVHAKLNLGTDAQSLGLNSQGQALRMNPSEPLTIRGYLIPGKVQGSADPHNAKVVHVSGVAETSFNLSDGSVYTVNGQTATSETTFTSTWQQLRNGSWNLVQYDETGGGT